MYRIDSLWDVFKDEEKIATSSINNNNCQCDANDVLDVVYDKHYCC